MTESPLLENAPLLAAGLARRAILQRGVEDARLFLPRRPTQPRAVTTLVFNTFLHLVGNRVGQHNNDWLLDGVNRESI